MREYIVTSHYYLNAFIRSEGDLKVNGGGVISDTSFAPRKNLHKSARRVINAV